MLSLALSLLSFSQIARSAPITPITHILSERAPAENATCAAISYAGDADLAVSIPAGVPIFYLEAPLESIYLVDSGDQTFQDQSLCGIQNDTAVVVVTDGASATFENVDLVKFGYTSDLNQASFFGLNAAINVANGSHAEGRNTNLTVHNGAAGWYSYGTGTTVNVTDSSFVATGPVSHGLYASGNGSIEASNFYCETYGYRSSCLSGDNPAGHLYIYDTEVRMWGLGSAVAYTVGSTYLKNVKGYTYQSFALISDGTQQVDVHDSDIEGGTNFATVVAFGSQPAIQVATFNFENTILRSHGSGHPIIGFANVIGNIYAKNISVVSESGILAVSNATGITQKFDHWRNADEGAAASAASGFVFLTESTLSGSIQAINGSSLSVSLADQTSWTGKSSVDSTENAAFIGVSIDATSSWTLSGDSVVQNLTLANGDLSLIKSAGHTIKYNATSSVNAWLNATTHSLSGGGSLSPMN